MNKYALYHVDGKYDYEELIEIVEAIDEDDAINQAYNEGIECMGGCYEDQEEDEEVECNCYYAAKLVALDAVIKKGKIYSKYENMTAELKRQRYLITSLPKQIEAIRTEMVELEKQWWEKEQKLKEVERNYGKYYEEVVLYIKKMNGR
jgi:hypothetical protein